MDTISISPSIDMCGGPDAAVLLADVSLFNRAKLAVHTLNTLFPSSGEPTEYDEDAARDAFTILTTEVTDKKPTNRGTTAVLQTLETYSRPAVKKLDALLTQYDEELVNGALRLREYTKNKLLEESTNPDGKIRIRALELLGKIKDVGLFTDRLEITHKTKSDEELEEEIRQRLERFMGSIDVVPHEVTTAKTPPNLTDVDNLL